LSFLELDSISKIFGADGARLVALDGLSLTVERGEFVALLGPSGCGKSTLLHIVAGLEPPSSGQVRLQGKPIAGWGSERTLIFQHPNLFPWLTAEENVAFGLRMGGQPRDAGRQAAHAALARMGLEGAARLYPHELSGGMQQRVALARALVLEPLVLLMDEPLASLDEPLRVRLGSELYAACADKTVLFVTHSIREALTLAERVCILSARPGRVLREVRPPGAPPRAPSEALLRLEQQILEELGAALP
jgi:NitT/TauT family transport system ATP-binding protein